MAELRPEDIVTNAAQRRPKGEHAPAWPPAGGPQGQALFRVLGVHENHIWLMRVDTDRPCTPFTARAADYVVDESVPADWTVVPTLEERAPDTEGVVSQGAAA